MSEPFYCKVTDLEYDARHNHPSENKSQTVYFTKVRRDLDGSIHDSYAVFYFYDRAGELIKSFTGCYQLYKFEWGLNTD